MKAVVVTTDEEEELWKSVAGALGISYASEALTGTVGGCWMRIVPDPLAGVRANALRHLLRTFPDERARELLERAKDDPEEAVRRMAFALAV